MTPIDETDPLRQFVQQTIREWRKKTNAAAAEMRRDPSLGWSRGSDVASAIWKECADQLEAGLAAPVPSLSECRECHCQTGGGNYCYKHAPYRVYPKADGSFLVDRNGMKHVWLDEPPTLETEQQSAVLRVGALGSRPPQEEPTE